MWLLVWNGNFRFISSQDTSTPSLPAQVPTTSSPSTSSGSNLTISPQPTTGSPTQSPSISSVPSMVPSFAGNASAPSPAPSVFKTSSPTSNLLIVKSPRLSMTLINMQHNVDSSPDFLRLWRNATSQHVRQYWGMYSESAPFFVARVVTTFISEERIPTDMDNLFNLSSAQNSTNIVSPENLEVVYMQDITYFERPTGDPSFFNFQTSNLFTIPFEQDGTSYTTALQTISNNSFIIFLDYTGVIPDPLPPPALTDPRNRNVIVIVVSVVAVVVLAASLYIYYVIRIKEFDNRTFSGTGVNGTELLGSEAPIIPAMIGVNSNEDVIVSESYDEDYTDSSFLRSTDNPALSVADVANATDAVPMSLLDMGLVPSSNDGDSGSPLRIATTSSREFDTSETFMLDPAGPTTSFDQPPQLLSQRDSTFGTPSRYGTVSTDPLTMSDLDNAEAPNETYITYSPLTAYRMAPAINGNYPNDLEYSPPSPLILGLGGGDEVDVIDHYYENHHEVNEDGDDPDDERNIPLMTGFQLEIQDLE